MNFKQIGNKEKIQDPSKKKVCRHCGNNQYQEKYTDHLKSKHAEYYKKMDILTNRHNGMLKYMTLEEITELLEFAKEMMKKRQTEK